jgi:hypothetical protein
MVDMKKKAIALLVAVIAIIITASIGLHSLRITAQEKKDNQSLSSTSSSAENASLVGPGKVGQEVVIEGNLTGPVGSEPEGAPPYDYLLRTNGGTIGVFYSDTDLVFDGTSVTVYGVVRAGKLAGPFSFLTVYYVEAERIEAR